MTTSVQQLATELLASHPISARLALRVGGIGLEVASNSDELVRVLSDYFGELVAETLERPNIRLIAIESKRHDFGVRLRDWPREPGKQGKKEAYADLPGGRVVLKVRTHMQFVLGSDVRLAIGPCIDNANQVINFINAQYMARHLHEGWSLCHAAGVVFKGRGLGIAARAGAGKSTLAMHLMSTGMSFVSNDRLLINHTARGVEMAGIPKMPRVNPGTLMNNADLVRILPHERHRELEGLSRAQLWQLEEKYDVPIDAIYGPGRCQYRAPLSGLLVLNWQDESAQPTRFAPVALASRPDLLELVMKSPGVFHCDEDGLHLSEKSDLNPDEYIRQLARVAVVEASGKANFPQAVAHCRQWLDPVP